MRWLGLVVTVLGCLLALGVSRPLELSRWRRQLNGGGVSAGELGLVESGSREHNTSVKLAIWASKFEALLD